MSELQWELLPPEIQAEAGVVELIHGSAYVARFDNGDGTVSYKVLRPNEVEPIQGGEA